MKSHRGKPRKRTLRDGRVGGAAEAIGPVEPGLEVFALTHGQFSLIDALVYLSGAIGPCDLRVSTWTAGNEDLSQMADMLATGTFRSVRFLVDRSFLTRQPAYCARLRELFGDEVIRTTRTHAKYATLENDAYHLAIRTSMNLNHNPRCENIEVSDDAALCDFLGGEFDRYFVDMDPGMFSAELLRSQPRTIATGKITAPRLYPTGRAIP